LPATPTEVLGFLLASGIYTNKIAQKPKNKKKGEEKPNKSTENRSKSHCHLLELREMWGL